MNFLNFREISFLPNCSIGLLCENLNNIVAQGVWHDKFQVKNTKSLWLVNDIDTTMNNDNVLCGSFGLHPSYATGILNFVKEIHFYLLCSEKLNYAGCDENVLPLKSTVLLIKRTQEIISSCHRVRNNCIFI